ncbi:MAG: hypothetical protein KJ579_08185 [Verrucomicrobia bacterium]|nr:hypothetical protein [Verrucomicrobiota bacterium]
MATALILAASVVGICGCRRQPDGWIRSEYAADDEVTVTARYSGVVGECDKAGWAYTGISFRVLGPDLYAGREIKYDDKVWGFDRGRLSEAGIYVIIVSSNAIMKSYWNCTCGLRMYRSEPEARRE